MDNEAGGGWSHADGTCEGEVGEGVDDGAFFGVGALAVEAVELEVEGVCGVGWPEVGAVGFEGGV